MRKTALLILGLSFVSGPAFADDPASKVRQVGNAIVAEDGAICAPHMDKNFGDVRVCVRKYRLTKFLKPILNRSKYSKCYAHLKIDAEGNVTKVKIKKFKGILAIKDNCKRTLFKMKFHPVRQGGAVGLEVRDVEFSFHYESSKVKKVQTLGITSQAVFGNVWDMDDAFFEQVYGQPIIVPTE